MMPRTKEQTEVMAMLETMYEKLGSQEKVAVEVGCVSRTAHRWLANNAMPSFAWQKAIRETFLRLKKEGKL